jgi:amino acid transporter
MICQQSVSAMFSFIRKAKIVIPFFSQRLADYAQLARLDLITFLNEMIGAIVGAAIGAAALLLLLCFICVAVIITEWDTPNRVRTAWLIAGVWGLITACCAGVAHFLLKGNSPFENIASEVALDLSVIKTSQANS